MQPTEPQSEVQSQPKANRVRIADLPRKSATDYVSAYANNTNANPSFYEITLLFGQIVTTPKGETHILDRASITMTWEHAFRLNSLLDRLLRDYQQEHNNGIRLMDDNGPDAKPVSE